MSPFNPLPLLGNPHVQTILGNLLTGTRTFRSHRRVVVLSDGDRVVLHETAPRVDTLDAPIALLVHGLGGCSRSAYMLRMTVRLRDQGWRVVRLDLRGAGAGERLARRLYNAGCASDVAQVANNVAAGYSRAAMAIVGFSLGGNIVLKCAGEFADTLPKSICAIAAVAPPIDLVRCSELIAHYPFYDAFYVRHLVRQVTAHQRHFPDLPVVAFPRRMILKQFDDIYTAPRWGYADAIEYYRQASSQPWIDAIRLPTFILTSRDDPFVAVAPFEELKPRSNVTVHIAPHGGHMGFLGLDGVGGIRWAETQMVDWLQAQIATR